ncbi:transporter substrate-binding domain-containing protein [Paraburkholderia diazotrophica]|uniref:transporter substrate-binding domain-containing protein n=1 Tax=Paraburkholderia diazotrophica TaxID=667676 RepID=UPI003171E4D1
MKVKKGVLLATLIATTAVSSLGARAADLLDAVKAQGVLRVGTEGTYPPFTYHDSDGKLVGFDVDVATALAAKLGVKPVFYTSEWSSLLAGVQAGRFDIVANEVDTTPQRKQTLDFSPAYAYSAAEVLVRKDEKGDYQSIDQLIGKTVAVGIGSNFETLAHSVPGINVKTYPGLAEALADLATGRVDAYLNDRLFVPYLLKTRNVPVRGAGVLKNSGEEVAFPYVKGNPKFSASVSEAMQSMQKDGTLSAISKKWFGSDVTRPVN